MPDETPEQTQDKKKFYVTTPIYYVNARPHIGHAYTTIVADVLARRHRLLGEEVFFLTGTDEHGQKIERSAAAAGVPPQQFADEVSAQFQGLWDRMGLTYDRYIRTTDEKHKRGVQKLFSELYERGHIYLDSYTGQYSIGEEMFVEGPPGTIGPDGKPTETVTEENFFFKLSTFQLPLLNLIESGELKIENDARRNEVLSFLRGNVAAARKAGPSDLDLLLTSTEASIMEDAASLPGAPSLLDLHTGDTTDSTQLAFTDAGSAYVPGALKDLSVSRSSFTWGIPVLQPAASQAAQKHVIYVWLDALANYMTAVGYGSDDAQDHAEFAKLWPADLHLVGKEIIRFHCVYWPAFLLAAGLPLPKAITAHGWLLFDNSKMSKSKGNIVRTETILEGFGEHVYGKQFPESTKRERDLFASDVLRYFLLREIPFGQDGSFSFEAMITRYNADLANGYGNLVSRTLKLIEQNLSGLVPEPAQPFLLRADISVVPKDIDLRLAQNMTETGTMLEAISAAAGVQDQYEVSRFDLAALNISARIKIVDMYLSSYEPWKLAKSEDPSSKPKVIEVLYAAAAAIRIFTAFLHPVLPLATAKVWEQLGLGDIEEAARNGDLDNLQWGGLKPGTKLGALAPIFPRADKGLAQIMADIENPRPATPDVSLKSAATPAPAEPIPTSTFDPAAPPRSGALNEPSGTLPVAGSAAIAVEREIVSHTDVVPSGAFATVASQMPITATASDAAPQITIDDFAKVELRVAEIKVAERIPKADKLLRLEVDLGTEKRQILSGIAEWYTPEELVGRRIVVITNLAPRKMRGLESHGMLLAASSGENGKPVLATFGEDIALGSRLK